MATPKRLRVAMLGQVSPDPSRVAGGVEAAVGVLCSEMARRPDVDLHVLCSAAAVSHPQDEARDGVTFHWLPRHPWGRATFYRRDTSDLLRVIGELRPDAVHAHGTGHYATAAVAAGRPATVITPHGIVFREAPFAAGVRERLGWRMQALWERRVLHGARNIVSISPYVERELGGRTRAAFHRIENPVLDAFFSIPPPHRSALVLWVGRLIPRKDPHAALRAFARVRSLRPEAELHIAGELDTDPGYARKTLELAAALRVGDAVRFLGEVDRESILEQYRGCCLVLLSSAQETAPVVIAQAMAAGRPVVTTAAGGCGDMVEDGETGAVVAVGDDVALADAMTRLIADRELSARMSAAARGAAWVRFRASTVVDKTLELYRELVSQTPRRE